MRFRGAAVALLLGLAPATAGDAATLGRQMVEALDNYDGEALRTLLGKFDQAAARGIAGNPEIAYDLCFAAAYHASANFEILNGALWESFTKRLCYVGEQAAKRSPDHVDAQAARADARYCSLLVADEVGHDATPQVWLDCIDLYIEVDNFDSYGSYPLERALALCRVGSRAKGVDPEPMRARGRTLCEEGRKRFPDVAYFREVQLDYRLMEIEALLATDKRAGTKSLGEYLAEVHHKATALKPDPVHLTAAADAVTVARSTKGCRLKTEYLSERIKAGAGRLLVELPRSSRWTWTPGKELSQGFGQATQRDRHGRTVRSIWFFTYFWNRNYSEAHTDIGGDNAMGLARMYFDSLNESFSRITKRRKPAKRRLNRHLSGSICFELRGTRTHGGPLVHSGCLVRDERRECTYLISIMSFTDAKEPDPEARFVVDSIRFP